jgi:hypothetical protein
MDLRSEKSHLARKLIKFSDFGDCYLGGNQRLWRKPTLSKIVSHSITNEEWV